MTVTVNGQPTDVAAGATVAGVVTDLARQETGVAVAVNGDVLPRAEWPTTQLRDGDQVEVLSAVQGG